MSTSEPTILPTYDTCYVCGSANAVVSDLARIVTVEGIPGSCLDLQAEGANGYIEPDICLSAQIVAQQQCGCVSVDESPPSPSPYPSPYPTFVEKCFVCGREESKVSLLDTVVSVDGGSGTCAELEWDGQNGYLNPSLCGEAQAVAKIECGCIDGTPTPSSSTFEPTVTFDQLLQPGLQVRPTYQHIKKGARFVVREKQCHWTM